MSSAKTFRPLADEGARLVSALETLFSRHIVLPAGVALVLSLSVVSTYLSECFDYCAYVAISSPVKRCGKTTLGQLLSWLCRRAMLTVGISVAALFHLIETYHPTLIMDEAENLVGDRGMRSFLNAGFRKGAVVPRVIGKHVVQFAVYGPKIVCLIGEVPETIRDRSILIEMRRAKPGEPIEELRERSVSHAAAELAAEIAGWAAANRENIIETYCHGEVDFLPDREANLWTPLFAIASVAIPERLDELKTVALRLVAEKAEHDTDSEATAIRLLSDIRTAFAAEATDLMPTGRLLAELHNPDSPWARLSGSDLARMLRPFEIRPKQLWLDGKNLRGYLRRDFSDAFARYLPAAEDNGSEDSRREVRKASGLAGLAATEGKDSEPARERAASRLEFIPE
jgi:Protein of unknown function (DUF3631)